MSICNWKRRNSFTMLMTTNNSNKRVQSNARSWRRNSNYGSPPWKKAAAFCFLSLFAVTFCRIAGGPKRHWNSHPQQDDVAEMLEGSCNFEASLHRAPTNCSLFLLPRGITQIAGTWKNREVDTYRNILDLPLFHKVWDPDTGSGCRIFGWWPDATHRTPLL